MSELERLTDEIARLRAAGELALYQLVIINGAYATDIRPEDRAAKLAQGAVIEWRIDTTEAIAALKAVLPLPPVAVPYGLSARQGEGAE